LEIRSSQNFLIQISFLSQVNFQFFEGLQSLLYQVSVIWKYSNFPLNPNYESEFKFFSSDFHNPWFKSSNQFQKYSEPRDQNYLISIFGPMSKFLSLRKFKTFIEIQIFFWIPPLQQAVKNLKSFSYLLLAYGPDLLAAHFLFPSFSQQLAHLPLGQCPPLAHQASSHHGVSLGHLTISQPSHPRARTARAIVKCVSMQQKHDMLESATALAQLAFRPCWPSNKYRPNSIHSLHPLPPDLAPPLAMNHRRRF
jgi:hypothetical protein